MILSDEIKLNLVNLAKLLNGQIRGALNKKAKEENLDLITLTLGSVFTDGYQLGYTQATNNITEQQIKEELKDDIAKAIKKSQK